MKNTDIAKNTLLVGRFVLNKNYQLKQLYSENSAILHYIVN